MHRRTEWIYNAQHINKIHFVNVGFQMFIIMPYFVSMEGRNVRNPKNPTLYWDNSLLLLLSPTVVSYLHSFDGIAIQSIYASIWLVWKIEMEESAVWLKLVSHVVKINDLKFLRNMESVMIITTCKLKYWLSRKPNSSKISVEP